MQRLPKEAGLTLLEAAIVLLIFALTAAGVASSATRGIQVWRLHQATRNLAADLREARQSTVLLGLSHGIVLTPHGYVVERAADQTTLRRIALDDGVSVGGGSIWFHRRGNAAPAGSIRLTAGGFTLRVVVAVSGRVRWEVVS